MRLMYLYLAVVLLLAGFAIWVQFTADKDLCKEFFPQVSVYTCLASKKMVVTPRQYENAH